MRTIQCRQLRSVLTAYVDDEISAGERLVVEGHLRQCDACRCRVRREGAVRLEQNGRLAQVLEERELFGYVSLLSRSSPVFDVVAEEDGFAFAAGDEKHRPSVFAGVGAG